MQNMGISQQYCAAQLEVAGRDLTSPRLTHTKEKGRWGHVMWKANFYCRILRDFKGKKENNAQRIHTQQNAEAIYYPLNAKLFLSGNLLFGQWFPSEKKIHIFSTCLKNWIGRGKLTHTLKIWSSFISVWYITNLNNLFTRKKLH